eukprot:TRINITY_DN14523_c0_g1_i1.p1 TRINITY_DN14523_c0_g1~~TRINITY_DN14523_c0_g1_i1.p1  ORF type:complete len:546 (+),score=150.30 TRINITY_DN14523_c0_g1_i1:61-1698(+)
MKSLGTLMACVASAAGMVELGGLRRDAFVGHGVNHVLHHHGLMDGVAVDSATTHFYTDAVLNHFAPVGGDGAARWRQRYYTDETYWCGEGCPVFVYIGGEGPQSAVSADSRLLMSDLAKQHSALLVTVEHRFYGESYPTPDMSDANMQYLSSEQALADLARIVTYIKAATPGQDTASDPPLNLKASAAKSKVVGFGGSYPGDLAAWVRLKYPSIFDGTIASSAPVYAEYNFEQYGEVVGAALKYPLIGGSADCFATAKAGAAALAALVASTTPMGTAEAIPEVFKPCTPIASDLDLSSYESAIFSTFQGVVQYNLQGRKPYVSDVCVALTNGGGSALDAFARAHELFVDKSAPFQDRCVESSWEKDMIKPLQSTKFDGSSSSRQWIWQSCNEFGFFQTTSGASADNAFGAFKALGVDKAGQKLCAEVFHLRNYTGPNTLWANTNYGNRDLQATNVVTPNGNMDPWHALGIVNATDAFYNTCTGGPCTPQRVAASDDVVLIDGTAHCRDMMRPNGIPGVPDTPSVQWAHAKVAAAVARFLAGDQTH